jgi:glucose/arabinose dehydrogenase
MVEIASRRRARLLAALGLAASGAALLAGVAASAQDDRFAPENKPTFPYPATPVNNAAFSVPGPAAWPSPPVGEGPWDFQSWEQRDYRVTAIARGLVQPRAITGLPNGDLLVTEISGRLRLIRDGALLPDPVAGAPEVYSAGTNGLRDVTLHPDFAENGLVYLTYDKPVWGDLGVPAVWRARWTGDALVEGADVFIGDDVETGVSRAAFGADGKLYVTIGGPATGEPERLIRAQHPDDYAGKTLRLNDDGSIPDDNPFLGVEGTNPEIFTLGHRNEEGLEQNPWTGEIWAAEQGPNGGDEINIIRAGKNYGWPIVSDGRDYRGPFMSEMPLTAGYERPHVGFLPSPALGGMAFYTGDRFPAWRRNLFVASAQWGEVPRSGHILRIVFNENWEEMSREMLLTDLHQRFRDVTQGADGLLYAITAEPDAVVLRIEPIEGAE